MADTDMSLAERLRDVTLEIRALEEELKSQTNPEMLPLEEFRVAYEQSVAPPKPEITLREHAAAPVRAAKRRPQGHRGRR